MPSASFDSPTSAITVESTQTPTANGIKGRKTRRAKHGSDNDEAETEVVSRSAHAALSGWEALAVDDRRRWRDQKGSAASVTSMASVGSSTSSLRFAPLRVPLERRKQTLAVLIHCTSIMVAMPLFFFCCAIPLAWPLLIPYILLVLFSTAATDGRLRWRSERFRSLPLWRWFAAYFPAQLHRTTELSPHRKYIFGYHPHGIISHGAWAAFATEGLGFSAKFPGITNCLLTLDSNFSIPFYREYLLLAGMRSVSRESIMNHLSRGGSDGTGTGRAVTIVIGGARESLQANPGTMRLVLHGRYGFIKMAMTTGADLVPVLGFGEVDLYQQLQGDAHPLLHRFQMYVLKAWKFTLPFMRGRGIFNYDYGLMPYRVPLNIVVGRPIAVEKATGNALDPAEVERLHGLYIAELQRLWDTYKDDYAKNRLEEMKILA